MIDLTISDEELNALKIYKENNYEAMNQMLVSNCETDIALLSDEVENQPISINYDRESVMKYLRNIKLVYRLMLKKYYSKLSENTPKLYRGTNLSEIEMFRNELFIDRFLSATYSEDEAINLYAAKWNRPACMNITLNSDVPYILVKDVLNEEKYGNEILISPFTKLKSITENEEKIIEKNSKCLKVYSVELEKQVLDELSDRERNGLYNYILDNAYSIRRKIEQCIELEHENVVNFENIRKLEQLLSKYESSIEEKELSDDYSDINRNVDYDDIERITRQLQELKNLSANIFEIRKQNIDFINIWKRNIAVYMIAECREIEKEVERAIVFYENNKENIEVNNENDVINKYEANVENTEKNVEKNNELDIDNIDEQENLDVIKNIDNISNSELTNQENNSNNNSDDINKNYTINKEELDTTTNNFEKEYTSENLDNQETRIVDIINDNEEDALKDGEDDNPLVIRVKAEAKENIEAGEKLLQDIKDLITKQQNHAKIAGNMGASYSALNNAFEMRNVAETLLELLKNINLKIKALCENIEIDGTEEKLEKISKTNIEISTLINYLNNPKIAARNTRATRFDEMAVIEENELKKGISEKIRSIRGEAELKKLKDDLEIIEDKGTFSRFFGIFTGQNKLDDFMVEQIEIRQKAIRKTLSRKLSLAYNYSIHELMADITMFINDNEDDELVEDDIMDLKALAEELRRNFVILETKVESIVEQKEGRNLPLENRKLSKKEIIEIETYRFLNKYGYDISDNDKEEPKYQDTMASEISRIIEYINSSNII